MSVKEGRSSGTDGLASESESDRQSSLRPRHFIWVYLLEHFVYLLPIMWSGKLPHTSAQQLGFSLSPDAVKLTNKISHHIQVQIKGSCWLYRLISRHFIRSMWLSQGHQQVSQHLQCCSTRKQLRSGRCVSHLPVHHLPAAVLSVIMRWAFRQLWDRHPLPPFWMTAVQVPGWSVCHQALHHSNVFYVQLLIRTFFFLIYLLTLCV